MKLQILCATMHQHDFSKIKDMNIRTNVVFANQADEFSYSETYFCNGKTGQMITTNTRGVGLNRNLAILFSDADILLFSDDDMVYKDDLEEGVLAAFEKFPDADCICFGCEYEKSNQIFEKKQYKSKKVYRFGKLGFGTIQLAIKRNSLLKYNVLFSQLYGGGCIYNHGEDTRFISDCLKKGMHMYTDSYIIGKNITDTSTWFSGYNEKYFYDDGAAVAYRCPHTKYFWGLFFAIRATSHKLSILQRIKAEFAGIRGSKNLKTYNEWEK